MPRFSRRIRYLRCLKKLVRIRLRLALQRRLDEAERDILKEDEDDDNYLSDDDSDSDWDSEVDEQILLHYELQKSKRNIFRETYMKTDSTFWQRFMDPKGTKDQNSRSYLE